MKHKKMSAGSPGVNLGLIITPMLDMSFQILAFFIMTYHPSALEGHIPGTLVPPDKILTKGKENTPSEDAMPVPEDQLIPELSEAITVKVKAITKGQEIGNRVEGSPSQMFIKQATDTQMQMIADVDVDFKEALKILEARLKDMVKKGATNKTNLKIEGDSDLRQQYIMMVYDTCKKAGFDKLHFVPPPVLNTKIQQ